MPSAIDSYLRPQDPGSHLKKLGMKTYAIAPGSVNGGSIFVMDKPAGIEEGSVVIPLDSQPYRHFVTMMILANTPEGTATPQLEALRAKLKDDVEYKTLLEELQTNSKLKKLSMQIGERYRKCVAEFNKLNAPMQFEKLTVLDDQIEYILRDEKLKKRRHGIKGEDVTKAITTFGKLHEIESGTSYYENIGLGGLLFSAYKAHCGIKKEDHFAVHIQKLIDKGNQVYMIKQDADMVLGGTGPGIGRIIKTGTGKKMQRLLHPGVVLATGGISAGIFGVAVSGWRGYYLMKNDPNSANADAIVETLSTKLASLRGFDSQGIDTIDGTYPDGSPKVCTIVTWSPGSRDLTGRLAGGKEDYSNVAVALDKNGRMIKVDTAGNILRTDEKDQNKYVKIDKDGNVLESTQVEYESGIAVSDDSIMGLGSSLLSFICMGDRDGVGESGQNKMILPLKPPKGNYQYRYYGIDFGKSYKGKNPIIDSLDDAFAFENPTSKESRFVNISILYDNPLREKMKGVYLLAALRGKLTPEDKEAIAKDYAASDDQEFANLLRGYPKEIDADLHLILQEEAKYRKLADEATTAKERTQYTTYANRVAEVYQLAKETDDKVLAVFAKRMHLPPSQIDILDNLEKLTAREATTLSPDGKVRLNHLRVEKTHRTPWQLERSADKKTYKLICDGANPGDVQNMLKKLHSDDFIGHILQKASVKNGKLEIDQLNETDIEFLSTHLTEEKVAQARNLDFRSEKERNQFHERLSSAVGKPITPSELEHEPELESESEFEPTLSTTPAAPLLEAEALLTVIPERELNPEPAAAPKRKRSSLTTPLYGATKNRVGFNIPSSSETPPSTPSSFEPRVVLTEHGGSLKEIKTFLEKEYQKEPEKRYIRIDKKPEEIQFNGNSALLVTFKNENKRSQTVIEESTQTGELIFSADKNLNDEDFVKTATEICRLAVLTASPKAVLDLTDSPEDKKEFLFKIFTQQIKEAVNAGKFTEETKPSIEGYSPPKQAMHPLFTASPRQRS
jgi:hypothetical protein